jgi:predicted regulator of Ras-like GTPase activity (Roadblock/LC7/MglB family)
MSAHATKTKPGFSGFLRRLFTKSEAPSETQEDGVVYNYYAEPAVDQSVPSHFPTGGGADAGKFVQLPLRSIIANLPLELRGKVKKVAIGDVTIPIQQSKILGQLASGAVRISFGEVRAAAPAVFLGGGDADKLSVTLPLSEILPRLNPALLARRPTQRHIEVAREISSPFEDPAQAVVFAAPSQRTSIPQAEPVPAPQTTIPFKPISRAPAPAPVEPEPVFTAAEAVAAPQPIPFKPISRAPAAAPVVPPPAPVEPEPVFTRAPSAPSQSVATPNKAANPIVVRMTKPPKNQAAPNLPVAPAATPPAASPSGPSILVTLASLAESWPESLREEIVQSGLAEARVSLPTELMEVSLKRGRVVFQWKVIRTWIRPAAKSYTSVHDGMEVELPLKAIAPLFLQKRSPNERIQQRLDIDESIPNLFFGFPKPDAAPAAPATDTNYYVWNDNNDNAQVEDAVFRRKAQSNGTEFVTKYATPNEIVSRASALDGVAGAVIALPDGLMVASQIPPEQNSETLAAFLPQIFAKVSQCTKELRMGDLNNLSFTVGNVPWKIFRVNAIFFAVFGREGESMPTTQLAGLAAELDRKHK